GPARAWRWALRAGYPLPPPGANVGAGPRTSADSARYDTFFKDFDAALAQLNKNIGDSVYGPCSSSPACQRAQAVYSQDTTLRSTLNSLVFGVAAAAGRWPPPARPHPRRPATPRI